MEYRQYNQPGCGGCFLLIVLFLLVTGGARALLNFLGFLFFSGLFGILLLIAIFWAFSFYVQKKISNYEASQTETHNRFVHLLAHILVKVAQADGHFTRAELNTMLNFFQYNLDYRQEQMYWVKQIIKDARDSTREINSLLQEFKDSFGYEPRLILLELVYQLIYTKSPVQEKELQLARDISSFLEISVYDQRTIEAKYIYRQRYDAASAANTDERNYAILGLSQGTDFNEIKQAYRKLSMQYHPDKVRHLGEEFRKVAEEKMKEINGAYDYFKRKYNNS